LSQIQMIHLEFDEKLNFKEWLTLSQPAYLHWNLRLFNVEVNQINERPSINQISICCCS